MREVCSRDRSKYKDKLRRVRKHSLQESSKKALRASDEDSKGTSEDWPSAKAPLSMA